MLRRQIPSTNSLFTFEAVARLGSFSQAADELNVTQPAVSRSISMLEEHLGYALFKRHGRWIELTHNGDKLFRATSTAFNTVDDAFREIGRLKENRETVTLGMTTTAANHWLIPRLHRFRQAFADVTPEFRLFNNLSDGAFPDADLSIRLSMPQDGDKHRWTFADEKVIALCSPQYLSQYGSLDKPVAGKPHSLIEQTNQRYRLDEFFHATGTRLPDNPSLIRFSDYPSILHATLQGHGIALAWVSEVSHHVVNKTLVPACTQVVKTGRRYHILASNLTPLRPVVEDVRDWLIAEMRNDTRKMAAALEEHWDLF